MTFLMTSLAFGLVLAYVLASIAGPPAGDRYTIPDCEPTDPS